MAARPASGHRYKSGARLRVALYFVLALVACGWLLDFWLTASDRNTVIDSSPVAGGSELDRVFSAAVEQMRRRDYRQAMTLWHQALMLAPEVTEIKVNMGFTLFELGRYEAAREFFIAAMEQNAFQANAYYGLAITSEKMGDISGALGAMRSYIHLADDSGEQEFVRRGRAALWEWEAQLSAANRPGSEPGQ